MCCILVSEPSVATSVATVGDYGRAHEHCWIEQVAIHHSLEDTRVCIKRAGVHLAGNDGLHEESEHGEHGEAAVLDLLHLHTPVDSTSTSIHPQQLS